MQHCMQKKRKKNALHHFITRAHCERVQRMQERRTRSNILWHGLGQLLWTSVKVKPIILFSAFLSVANQKLVHSFFTTHFTYVGGVLSLGKCLLVYILSFLGASYNV
ncbi:unnamed protein product [Ixodes pacificus]